jgi:hypothetical protein
MLRYTYIVLFTIVWQVLDVMILQIAFENDIQPVQQEGQMAKALNCQWNRMGGKPVHQGLCNKPGE